MNLLPKIEEFITSLNQTSITNERKKILQPLIDYVQAKVSAKDEILLNFICTHNSRRSHFSQIWAQSIAHYFNVKKLNCYSGGTEATAVFPMVIKTLENAGFQIAKLSEENNPNYSIKFAEYAPSIISFSKRIENDFNPKSNFGAIMTCSEAETACPIVLGAEKRIAITYEDPKVFDNTPLQEEKYLERSVQIATELHFVFSQIKF